MALVLALIVVAAMSISTVALVGLVTSNETAFGRDRQEIRALNIGQSGLNYGVSYMQQYLAANDSTNGRCRWARRSARAALRCIRERWTEAR